MNLNFDEVLVEYERLCTQTGKPCGMQCFSEEVCNQNITLKVNSNNEITIHPVKDNWSREELLAEINHYSSTVDKILLKGFIENL